MAAIASDEGSGVTEKDWLRSSDPEALLKHVRKTAGVRRLRLFGCACCRRIWPLIKPRCRGAIEVAERHGEGRASDADLEAAYQRAAGEWDFAPIAAYVSSMFQKSQGLEWTSTFREACRSEEMCENIKYVALATADAAGKDDPRIRYEERIWQAAVLRDIMGNPFKPVAIPPEWLTWNHGSVPHLAQAIFDNGSFEDLPILGDALIEAGCHDEALLSHCRSGGPHVRGCWVVDALVRRS